MEFNPDMSPATGEMKPGIERNNPAERKIEQSAQALIDELALIAADPANPGAKAAKKDIAAIEKLAKRAIDAVTAPPAPPSE